MYKNVSRRREKKGRLRRDDCRDAAITVWGYRGVSGFYDPAIPLLFFYTAKTSGDRAVAKRRGAYAAMTLLTFVLQSEIMIKYPPHL